MMTMPVKRQCRVSSSLLDQLVLLRTEALEESMKTVPRIAPIAEGRLKEHRGGRTR